MLSSLIKTKSYRPETGAGKFYLCLALSFLLVISITLTTPLFASPPAQEFTPNQTLDPNCLPGEVNCVVAGLWNASGDYITSTASIGVGTTTPAASLAVRGNTYLAGNLTATGTLLVTGNASFGTIASGTWNGNVIGLTYGGTGTTIAPVYGQVLLGNSLGTYDLVATSSLGLAFSTTSNNYWESLQTRWATTSNTYWESLQTRWSTTSSDFYVNASTTIPKTYTTNTFTAPQTITYASTTALTVGGNSYLGTVAAGTWNGTVIGLNFGGTGTTTAPSYGQMLLGNALGTYDLVATTSLGFSTGSGTVNSGLTGQLAFYNGNGTTLSGTSTLTVTSADLVGIGTSTPTAKLFMAGGNFVHSAYGNPTLKGTVDTTGTARAVYVANGYAYVADREAGLQIISLANPAAPTVVSTLSVGDWAWGIQVVGKYAYIASNNAGLKIVDISNPTVPYVSSTLASTLAVDVYVAGKYAYVADDTNGLNIVDVSDPFVPRLVGNYNTAGNARGVYVAGKYAYVADGDAGLQVIDVANPTNPTLTGTYNTAGSAWDVTVSGNYAYIADEVGGLKIVNITNPASPSLTGAYIPGAGNAYGVSVNGKYAYLANDTAGLYVVDVSVPASPALVGSYDTGAFAWDVYVDGKYAYVADSGDGLYVIDINGEETPALTTGSVGTNNLVVTDNADIGGLFIQSGLTVGNGGILSGGALSVTATTTPSYFGGSLGLGTTSPFAKLTVAGDLMSTGRLYDNNYSAGTNGMVLQTTGTGYQWVATSSLGISGGSSQWTTTGSDIYYATGKVAIGTTTAPTNALQVTGDANYLATLYRASTTLGTGSLINFAYGSTTSPLYSGYLGSVIGSTGTVNDGIDSFNLMMLHFDGTGTNVTDSSASAHTATFSGTATQSTAQSKFGGSSAVFGNSGDTLTVPNSTDFDVATGDFTIDAWVYINSTGKHHQIVSHTALNAFGPIRLNILDSGPLQLLQEASGGGWAINTSGATNVTAGTWHHIALVRNGSNISVYLDGVSTISQTYAGNFSASTEPVYIGSNNFDSAYSFGGYIDEFRWSKGIARWTANFTPPTSAYSSVSAGTGGNLVFGTSNGVGGLDSLTERMRITYDGNVGIGTTSPFTKLTVSGNALITGALFDSSLASGTLGMVLKSTASGFQWVATSTLGLSQWSTAGLNIGYLSGNVGIGTTTNLQSALQVSGDSSNFLLTIQRATSTTATSSALIKFSNATSSTITTAYIGSVGSTYLTGGADAGYTVSGAGSTDAASMAFNGVYTLFGTNNGAPTYRIDATHNLYCALDDMAMPNVYYWVLDSSINTTLWAGAPFYVTSASAATCNTANITGGWQAWMAGEPPAPTVALTTPTNYTGESNLVFATNPTPTSTTAVTERMRITGQGFVGIGSTTPTYLLSLNGGAYSDGTNWTNASSRTLKENFIPVNKDDILNKINQLEMTSWNYKTQTASTTHIGPIAEDFYQLFKLGNTDQSISSIDPAGVALVGIQALTDKFTAVFGTTTMPTTSEILITKSAVLSYLETLGLKFLATANTAMVYIKNLVVENLTLGSSDRPAGITLYDEDNGQPYCLKIKNGNNVSVPGVCGSPITSSNSSQDIVNNNPVTVTSTTTEAFSTTSEPLSATTTETVISTTTESVVSTTTESITATTTEPVSEPIIITPTTTEEVIVPSIPVIPPPTTSVETVVAPVSETIVTEPVAPVVTP